MLAGYATNVKDNFPVADATVLSSGGRARTGALDNVGSLAGEQGLREEGAASPMPCHAFCARVPPLRRRTHVTVPLHLPTPSSRPPCTGMIRRHKTAAAVKDIDQLPVVMSGRPAATNVLARTTSGNLVTAPSTSVVPADSFTTRPSLNGGSSSGGSSGPAGGASSAAASSAKPADKPATPSAAAAAAAVPASSSTASKPQPQGMVAVSAAAGTGAAAAAATTAKSPASPVAAAKVEEVKAIQALPSSSDIGRVELQELSLREQSLLQRQEGVTAARSGHKRLSWPVRGPGMARAGSSRATAHH